jgi:hypothetical protein
MRARVSELAVAGATYPWPRPRPTSVAFTVQPVMFVLLFVYVFGGAINTPGTTTSTS